MGFTVRRFDLLRRCAVWCAEYFWQGLWKFRYFHAYGFSVTVLAIEADRGKLDGATLAGTVAAMFVTLCGGAALTRRRKEGPLI